jgi:hypothetical protein
MLESRAVSARKFEEGNFIKSVIGIICIKSRKNGFLLKQNAFAIVYGVKLG